MAPKGGNSKKDEGRARKAEKEQGKKNAAAADQERKVAATWVDEDTKGGKAKKQAQEEKRKQDLARKQEAARLLAEEEAAAPAKVKAAPKAGKKKEAARPAGPGAIAAGGGLAADDKGKGREEEPEAFHATGIDNALDLLEVVTAKMDKASVGTQAAGIERHPERRFKAAFAAYSEREMPVLRSDHPGLRLQQYQDLLYKNFQKSPENPFNQVTVSYDASKADKVAALNAKKSQVEQRLKEKR